MWNLIKRGLFISFSIMLGVSLLFLIISFANHEKIINDPTIAFLILVLISLVGVLIFKDYSKKNYKNEDVVFFKKDITNEETTVKMDEYMYADMYGVKSRFIKIGIISIPVICLFFIIGFVGDMFENDKYRIASNAEDLFGIVILFLIGVGTFFLLKQKKIFGNVWFFPKKLKILIYISSIPGFLIGACMVLGIIWASFIWISIGIGS
jgi:hypothetical protein